MATLINHVETNNLSGTTATTLAAPSLNVQAGDLIYVFAFSETNSTITFSDSSSQTYVPKTALSDLVPDAYGRHGYLLSSVANAALVVTANFSPAAAYRRIGVLQFRPGGGETLTFDNETTKAASPGESAGGPAIVLDAGTFVTGGACIIACGITEIHNIGWTASSGYTVDATGDPFTTHKISVAGASETPSGTADRDPPLGGGTIEYAALALSFKITSGGGGGNPVAWIRA